MHCPDRDYRDQVRRLRRNLAPIGTQPVLGDHPAGYVQQWNLNIQRNLPGGFFVSAAYVGSKGTHLQSYFRWPQSSAELLLRVSLFVPVRMRCAGHAVLGAMQKYGSAVHTA